MSENLLKACEPGDLGEIFRDIVVIIIDSVFGWEINDSPFEKQPCGTNARTSGLTQIITLHDK